MNVRFKFRIPVLSEHYEFEGFKYINWYEPYYEDAYEPQECIGINKEKQLIFCGDIIQNKNSGTIYEIVYDEENFRYIGKGICNKCRGSICYINFDIHRVIGNIYESKELLEILQKHLQE